MAPLNAIPAATRERRETGRCEEQGTADVRLNSRSCVHTSLFA